MNTKKENMRFMNAYEDFSDAIYRHCYFRISDHDKALDLMQETFKKTWQYVSNGNKVKDMKSFLYKTATNLIIDQYRKKKELSLDMLQEGGFEPSEEPQITFVADRQNILKLLDNLDDKYKEVIVLRYIDDMTPKEIAKAINETENVVSVRIHRGIKRINELVKNG